jgi:hypothetical protein
LSLGFGCQWIHFLPSIPVQRLWLISETPEPPCRCPAPTCHAKTFPRPFTFLHSFRSVSNQHQPDIVLLLLLLLLLLISSTVPFSLTFASEFGTFCTVMMGSTRSARWADIALSLHRRRPTSGSRSRQPLSQSRETQRQPTFTTKRAPI